MTLSAFDDKASPPTDQALEAAPALIDEAPKFAEGRGVRIAVRNKSDLDSVESLVAIKVAS